jgi:DNA transposition AAA+ family ATPase
MTPSRIAEASGINASRLSQWRAGKYRGDNLATAKAVEKWLDTRAAREQAQAELPAAPPFVLTDTAEKIQNAISYAHHAGDIVLIYGGAGVGKTETIRDYVGTHSGVCLVTFTPAHNTLRSALNSIASCVGVQVRRETNFTFDAICRALKERQGLLIIDEAQHVNANTLDMIRAIHDRTGCGIVYSGNEMVYTNLTGGDRAAYLDRLSSRVGMRLAIKRATATDARQIAQAWGIDSADIHKLLGEIAGKPGGLRACTKVLRLAHMFRGGEALGAKHVRAAFNQLNGVSV